MIDISRIEEYIRQQSTALRDYEPPVDSSVDELQSLVKQFTEVDKNILSLKHIMAAWGVHRRDLENHILEIMKDQSLDGLNTSEAVIKCVTKTRKKRVTREKMKRDIESIIKDEDMRNNVLRLICNEEPVMSDPKQTLQRHQLV